MLKNIMRFYERAMGAVDMGIQLKTISSMKVMEKIGRMKEIPEDKMNDIEAIYRDVDTEFDSLKRE